MNAEPLCGLCGGKTSPAFLVRRSEYSRCATCHTFHRVTPEVAHIQETEYRSRYGDDPRVMAAAGRREDLWPILLDQIQSQTPTFKPSISSRGRLLDFGCGFGGFIEAAAQRGWESFGTEINPTMREACQRRGLAVGDDSLGDMVADGTRFDVVCFWNVLDSLPSPGEALAEAEQLLHGGGQIWMRVPNAAFHGWFLEQASKNGWFGSWWLRKEFTPLNEWLFSPEGLALGLEKVGFKGVRIGASSLAHRLFLQSLTHAARLLPGGGKREMRWSPSLLVYGTKGHDLNSL